MNRKSGEVALAIILSRTLSLRFLSSFFAWGTEAVLEGAFFGGDGTGGVELNGGGLVGVLFVSSCLVSSGF